MTKTEFQVGSKDDGKRHMLFGLYLLFVGAFTITFGYIMARGDDSYAVGDWLINYSGGFVRRGLPGWFVLQVGHATGIPLAAVVLVVQSIVFLAFLAGIYRLSEGIRWSYLMTAVLLSPATIAFTVMDFYAGMRKDVLLFAGLALAICAIVSGRLRNWQLSALLCVIVVGVTLSHEALVVCTPYLFAAVAIESGSARRALRICVAPLLLGAAALIAVALHPGNLAIAEAVCRSVGGKMAPVTSPDASICAGSIGWLQYNLAQARAEILPTIRSSHMVRRMCLLMIPTFAPLIALLAVNYRRDRLHREVGTIVGCGLVSLVGTAFLFYSAMDWGRWLHMQAICLMLMALMIDRRAERRPAQTISTALGNRWWRATAALAVFLYATTWTLPSIGKVAVGQGYPNVLRMIRHWVPRPPAHPWGE